MVNGARSQNMSIIDTDFSGCQDRASLASMWFLAPGPNLHEFPNQGYQYSNAG